MHSWLFGAFLLYEVVSLSSWVVSATEDEANNLGTDNDNPKDWYNVIVSCGADAVKITLYTKEPYRGRLYVHGRYRVPACEVLGDATQTTILTLRYDDARCGTVDRLSGTFQSTVMIQHHPSIQQDTDVAYSVYCDFPQVTQETLTSNMITFGNSTTSKTATAHPYYPELRFRITNEDGSDVTLAKIGQKLNLIIQVPNETLYDVDMADMVATDGTDSKSVILLDRYGCIASTAIFHSFGKLENSKSMGGTFQAFKFPGDPIVNFKAGVKFCPGNCEKVVDCRAHLNEERRRRNAPDETVIVQESEYSISKMITGQVVEFSLVVEDDEQNEIHLLHRNLPKSDERVLRQESPGNSLCLNSNVFIVCVSAVIASYLVIAGIVVMPWFLRRWRGELY